MFNESATISVPILPEEWIAHRRRGGTPFYSAKLAVVPTALSDRSSDATGGCLWSCGRLLQRDDIADLFGRAPTLSHYGPMPRGLCFH